MTPPEHTIRSWMYRPVFGPIIGNAIMHRALLVGCALQLAIGQAGWMGIQCPVPQLFGVPCPGCGLTRGVLALLHGDLLHAVQYHLFSPVALLAIVVLAVAAMLPGATRNRYAIRVEAVERASGVSSVLIVLLCMYWGARLVILPHI